MLTGPTKQETRNIIVTLEKKSRKTKKGVWNVIAENLNSGTRRRASVNIFHLNKMALKNKDKVLVVPGKVLSSGDATTKITVACLDCSEKAREKIEAAKGKVVSLRELVDSKAEAKNLVMVK